MKIKVRKKTIIVLLVIISIVFILLNYNDLIEGFKAGYNQ